MWHIKQLTFVSLAFLMLQASVVAQQTTQSNDSVQQSDTLPASVDSARSPVLSEYVIHDATGQDYRCYIGEVSQDGRTAALFTVDDGKYYVLWNGSRSKGYDKLVSLYVSPHGLRCGFFALKGKDYYAVVDGKSFGKYRDLGDSITFSADDSQYYFTAMRKGEFADWIVSVLNGDEVKRDNVLQTTPDYFSPDGSRSAFFVRDGKQCRVIVDGHEGPKYDLTGIGPLWSNDGSRLAYVGSRNDTMYAVVNGKEFGGHTAITSMVFSPDGSEIAYGASENYDYFMIQGDKRYGPYQEVWNPTYSPDGGHFAFAAMRDTMIFMVADGVEHTPYRDVSWPVYSPSGNRLAYTIYHGSSPEDFSQVTWIDGEIGPEYAYVYPNTLVFSPNGEHFGYIAEIDTLRIVAVIDGVVGKEYQTIGDLELSNSAYVYRAQISDSTWCIVRDGQESQHFRQVWELAQSPNRNHTACFVVDNDRLRLWLDGNLYGHYVKVRPDIPVFGDDRAVNFCAAPNDMKVLSVSVTWE